MNPTNEELGALLMAVGRIMVREPTNFWDVLNGGYDTELEDVLRYEIGLDRIRELLKLGPKATIELL